MSPDFTVELVTIPCICLGASYIGMPDFDMDFHSRMQIYESIYQSQIHQRASVDSRVISLLSINVSDPIYQSSRYYSNLGLEIAPMVAGGYGIAKGIFRWSKLARLPKGATEFAKRAGKEIAVDVTKGGVQLGKHNPRAKISQLEGKLSEWLGKETRMIKNKAGDLVFLSKDARKRVRFDFLRPNPHNNPHMHLEELIDNEWIGPRIYPKDVPNN